MCVFALRSPVVEHTVVKCLGVIAGAYTDQGMHNAFQLVSLTAASCCSCTAKHLVPMHLNWSLQS